MKRISVNLDWNKMLYEVEKDGVIKTFQFVCEDGMPKINKAIFRAYFQQHYPQIDKSTLIFGLSAYEAYFIVDTIFIED